MIPLEFPVTYLFEIKKETSQKDGVQESYNRKAVNMFTKNRSMV